LELIDLGGAFACAMTGARPASTLDITLAMIVSLTVAGAVGG
jgi:hypothetical protein